MWKFLSCVCLFVTPRTLVHGILQARILEWVVYPFPSGSSSYQGSRPIHIAANGIISLFFYGWVLFHCVYIPHLLYLSICWWILRLLPHLGCYSDTSCRNRLSFMLVVRNFWLDHRKQGVGGNSENMVLMAFTSIGHPLCTTHLSPSPRPLPQSSSCSGLHVAVWGRATWS